MYTVNATELKNRLGPVLSRAALEPVAIVRHGRIVAHLVPAQQPGVPLRANAPSSRRGLSRRNEERLVHLCASGDLRPSRWLKAGDRKLLAGVATMLASQPEFDRVRLLSLAERLSPGMSRPEEFGRWLRTAPVKAARLLPMVRAEMARAARE
jgi:prevent-host-death family protein